MRIKAISGQIVELRHFRFSHSNVQLLIKILQEAPNLKLETTDGRQLPIHALDLSWESLRSINPEETR